MTTALLLVLSSWSMLLSGGNQTAIDSSYGIGLSVPAGWTSAIVPGHVSIRTQTDVIARIAVEEVSGSRVQRRHYEYLYRLGMDEQYNGVLGYTISDTTYRGHAASVTRFTYKRSYDNDRMFRVVKLTTILERRAYSITVEAPEAEWPNLDRLFASTLDSAIAPVLTIVDPTRTPSKAKKRKKKG